MRSRAPENVGVVRTIALGLLLVFASGSPAPVAVAQGGPPPLTPFRGLIDHVSAAPSGWPPSGSVESGSHAISGDGRYVVMESNSWDLFPGDANGSTDVFLRDRQTGTMARVSVADDGSEAQGMSQIGSISANGRHVAFASNAPNLVAGDVNGVWDIFVRDLDRGRTVRVSVATSGVPADADSYWPVISGDGRFVAFLSSASTLAPGAAQYQPNQAYIHDRDADGNGVFDDPGGTSTSLVSVSASGGFADAYADGVRVSDDGRFVLFESAAANLDPAGNLDHVTHLYLRDRQAGTTAMIDRMPGGAPSMSGVYYRASDLSGDGRYVTYVSPSTDVVGLPPAGQAQVFRYDTAAADPVFATAIVSALPDGTLADGAAFASSISSDGRYVAFTTSATNLAAPAPAPGTGAVVVRDMTGGTFTRVDVIESGAPFDHVYPYSPSLSADGSAVAFQSNAVNAVGGMFTWGSQHVFVATAFAVSPASASFAMAGGTGTLDVNATAVSGWKAVSLDPWIFLTDGDAFAAGPRTIHYAVAANDAGIVRDGRIQVGSTIVPIHQEGDGDVTPPVITPTVTGNLGGDGWYVGDVTVQFTVSDPDSPITAQSYGCGGVVIATDTIYAPITCEATSHGGTSTKTVVIVRDTTAPTIAISTPAATLYTAGTSVTPSFTCTDSSGYSGVEKCAISEGASPLDTTPGRHGFTVTASDRAGNVTSKRVEYFVGTGGCVPANDGLKAWWRFEDDTADQLQNFVAEPAPGNSMIYAPGVAGRSWQLQVPKYLDTHDGDGLLATNVLTVAAWLKPAAQFGESGTIVSKPAQYRIARYPDGTLRWAFNQNGVMTWVNTGVVIPANTWSHVAVTYDHGIVTTFVNGRPVHGLQLPGTLTAGMNPLASMTIAGRPDLNAFYLGSIDELQVFAAALTAAEIEGLALAGSGGLCLPVNTTLTVTAPASVSFGSSFPVTATLRDGAGQPRAGKLVTVTSYLSATGAPAGVTSATTDSFGRVQVQVSMAPDAVVRSYTAGVIADFKGDAKNAPSKGTASVTVVKGTPSITWPSPSSIVYGTALSSAQLNATADTGGTFIYTPPPGAVLGAGSRLLDATFTPADTTRWNTASATRTLLVKKAAPVITATGGTFTYDLQAHPGGGVARGVFGETLTPVQVLYDGTSQIAPVAAGVYAVTAAYAGSVNYSSGVSSAVPLVITKAVPALTIGGGPFTFDGRTHEATVAVRGAGGEALSPYSVLYDGGLALPVQGGAHTVTVSYGGDPNYEPATAAGTLVIAPATPIMSLGDMTVTYDGQPHGVAVNVAGVNGDWLTPVIVTYNGSVTTPTDAGTYTIDARYDGSVNYTAIAKTATLTILKAQPRLTWTNPAGIVYGTALGAAQLNAASDIAGTFSYSPSAGATLGAGTHALSASFTPADAVNYQSGSVAVTLSVSKANVTITWTRPDDLVYGTPLGVAQLSATASVPGTFTYTPDAGTVLNAGEQVLSAVFVPADGANYNGATAGAPLTVTKAATTITWPSPAGIVYGTALGVAQLNATANVPGTFTYSPAAGTVLGSGAQTLAVTFTPHDAANYSGASATVTVDVAKAATTITWPSPADIVYGTALGAAQLNATANVPGTFTYSYGSTVFLGAGAHTLSVTFTPADAANYTGASAATTLTVTRAPLTIATNAMAKPYGVPLPPFSASATGLVNGDSLASLTGVLSFVTPATAASPVGTYPVTPQGLSSPNYTITFLPGTLTVVQALTSTALVASPNPSGFNEAVTLTATVSMLPPGGGSPSGVVQFFDGATLLGTVPLTTSGTAALTTNGLAAGSHTLTAAYGGDPNFAASSQAGALTVKAASGSSTTTVTSSANPATTGQTVTLTAAIAAPSTPTGSVAFYDGSVLIGTVSVSGTSARLTTAGLADGGHAITAVYLGNASIPPSTSRAFAQYVQPSGAKTRAATIALAATPSPATLGSTVTLTATVTGSQNQRPTGRVLFMLNGAVLGEGTLSAAGTLTAKTTLNFAALAHGSHRVEAVYLGDGTFRAAATVISLAVN